MVSLSDLMIGIAGLKQGHLRSTFSLVVFVLLKTFEEPQHLRNTCCFCKQEQRIWDNNSSIVTSSPLLFTSFPRTQLRIRIGYVSLKGTYCLSNFSGSRPLHFHLFIPNFGGRSLNLWLISWSFDLFSHQLLTGGRLSSADQSHRMPIYSLFFHSFIDCRSTQMPSIILTLSINWAAITDCITKTKLCPLNHNQMRRPE